MNLSGYLIRIHVHRIRLNDVWKEYMSKCIDGDFMSEKKAALREFEEKKIELKDNLVHELEERKKQIEQDRFTMELYPDTSEVKIVSTRKLRRRSNEPIPVPEKRRKAPQSQVTYLLDDKEMDDDLRALYKGKATVTSPQKKAGKY